MNARTDVPEIPGLPVLGYPPVDGTDDGLDEWVEGFVDEVLGPLDEESGNHLHAEAPPV